MHFFRSFHGLRLFFIAGIALAVAGCPEPGTVAVPDVTGFSRLTAELAITATGLTVGTITEQPNDTVTAGSVISQTPAAGQIRALGSTVHLVIAQSAPSVVVPDVTGLPQATATAALAAEGLHAGTITKQFSGSVPYNGVISQTPPAGATVAPGSAIDLVVSKGPASVSVPNVVSLSETAASAALTAAGLTTGTISQQSSATVPAGSVITQIPAAGTNAPAGSAVNLIVSSGAASVAVPNVVGFTQSVAESLLSLMGLTVGTLSEQFSDTVQTGRVISQNPVSGARVMAGDPVDIVLSKGPAPLSIPNVVGLTRAAAETAITSAGLLLESVTEQYSDTVPEGQVLRQYPAAGSDAAPGDSVNLALSGGNAPVTVPNVMGLTQSAAEYSLTFSGLVLGTVTEAFSPTVPEGHVCAQNPVTGATATSGSPVHITLSKGPEPVPVPNIVGLSRSIAETTLAAATLRVGSTTLEYSDTVPEGTVIRQDPLPATSVPPDTPVDFVVSLGVEPVPVPDIVGLARSAAEAAITAGALTVGTVTEEYSDTVPEGTIISQYPAAETSVQPGTAVNFTVSLGVEPLYAPNVVGLTRPAAEAAIIARGLIVGSVTEAYSGTVPSGSVISQSPHAGIEVLLGDPVNLVVSRGPEPVAVPDVVSLTRSNATAALVAGGLRVGRVTEQYSDTVPNDCVISHFPAAGVSVPPKTHVDLVVSKGPTPVLVPDVVGLSRSDAETSIIAGGLYVSRVTSVYSDTVADGYVIGQYPASGASVPPNTQIDLVVSKGPAPVPVPDVVGLARPAAEAAIIAEGLTVGSVTEENSETVPAGHVISQDPVGGTSVLHGSAVDLVVSTSPSADLTIDRTMVRLSMGAPIATLRITNAAESTLRWTATTDNPDLVLNPSSFTGNLKEVTLTTTGVWASREAQVRFTNDDLPSDFEEVDVYIAYATPGEMVSVEAGAFQMGDLYAEGDPQELPVHTVALSAYEMGMYPVTNQEYADALNWANARGYLTIAPPTNVVKAYGQVLLSSAASGERISYIQGTFVPVSPDLVAIGDHPAQVTWYGAAAYCNWLSAMHDLQPCYDTSTWACDFSKTGYHLPTEAQWERAASWSFLGHLPYAFLENTIDARDCNFNRNNPQGLSNEPYTSPVGYFDGQMPGTWDCSSPFCCYDMSGNVWEWCNDWCDYQYYEHSPANDPTGPESGEGRAVRGGSYSAPASECRTAGRYARSPELESGFRIAKAPEQRVTVPDLAGLSRVEAEALLASDGLVVFEQALLPSDTVAPYRIMGQTPAAGAVVADGSLVGITLSYGPFPEPRNMVHVPDGSFLMGDPWGEGESQELPVHAVALSAYEIGKHEVTYDQMLYVLNWAERRGYLQMWEDRPVMADGTVMAYGQVLLDLSRTTPFMYEISYFNINPVAPYWITERQEPTHISWYGAAAYCNWVSEMEGLEPCYDTATWVCDFSKNGYHLPTEAQWERAAAWDGSSHMRYGFAGDTIDATRCCYEDGGDFFLRAHPYTTPVGYYNGANETVDSPSPVGCYDMSGNVWEWCHDWYDATYYASSPGTDPTGPGAHTERVLRGGSRYDTETNCRSAKRFFADPSNPSAGFGFRIAR